MSAKIAASLRAIEQQLRTHPETVDLTRANAVIGEATTVLAGTSRDLASVAAGPATSTAAAVASPRARAALATSGQLRTSAALHAQGAAATAAAAPAVDPRIQWAAGHTNSR